MPPSLPSDSWHVLPISNNTITIYSVVQVTTSEHSLFLFSSHTFFFFSFFLIYLFVVNFVIHWNETAMGLHVFHTFHMYILV